MACSKPSLAVDLGMKENGKRNIKFLPHRVDFSYQNYVDKYGGALLALPCGKCDGCILARRKMWSLRCYCESLYHRDNCFITLTYDDDHLPKKLVKSDFQDFIKGLRNLGFKVRYYGCGEYGGETGRPHYHIILFGFIPDDLKYHSKTKHGYYQFTSKLLSDIWAKGFVTVSDFTAETAAYTAGYVDKKYKVRDCFTLMSKRPGLGEKYFLDHYKTIYDNRSIVTNFGSHVSAIPAYFNKLAEKINFDISIIKEENIRNMSYQVYKDMRELGTSHFEDLEKYRAVINKEKLDGKRRSL